MRTIRLQTIHALGTRCQYWWGYPCLMSAVGELALYGQFQCIMCNGHMETPLPLNRQIDTSENITFPLLNRIKFKNFSLQIRLSRIKMARKKIYVFHTFEINPWEFLHCISRESLSGILWIVSFEIFLPLTPPPSLLFKDHQLNDHINHK